MSERVKAVAPVRPTTTAPASPTRPSITPVPTALLQRACACGQLPGSGGKCDDCDKKNKDKMLQRASNGGPQPSAVPNVVNQALSLPGRPLDTPTRSFMESRFGHDFGGVRVHDDSLAAESARAVNAKAYTVGNDVVFDRGQYNPNTQSGRHLLAHELAHTVQQGGVHRYANDLRVGGAMESHLEREADSVARAVTGDPSGVAAPIVAVPTRFGAPILSRAENDAATTPQGAGPQEAPAEEPIRSWEPIPASEPDLAKICSAQSKLRPGVISSKIRAYKVREPLPVPKEKGPVIGLWQQLATAGGLQSVIDTSGNPRSALKQERPPTDDLRRIWLRRVRWARENAAANWELAGGDKSKHFEPKAGTNTCEMDHVVELQVGGNNTPENILPLDRAENGASGRDLFKYLKDKAQEIRSLTNVDQIILFFDNVAQSAPTCNICCQIAQKADAMATAAATALSKQEFESYEIKAGLSTTLALPLGTSGKRNTNPKVKIVDSENPKNQDASTLVPGMVLETLHLKSKGSDEIDGFIDTTNAKTRLPITIDKVKGKERSVTFTVNDARELKLAKRSENPKIAFTFPYLSPGIITHLEYDPSVGLSGSGKIKPNKPLLNKIELGFSFTPTSFKITAEIDPKKITPPFPGVTITNPGLSIGYSEGLRASGGFGFEFARGGKKIVYGSVEILTDGSGLVAEGKVKAQIPGVDEEKTKGEVRYKDGKWQGLMHIETGDINLPGIEKGSITAGFDNEGVFGGGHVELKVPGGHKANLSLAYANHHWLFRGKGVFKIPRLEETTLDISFDGEKFYAKGNAAFKFRNLQGKVTVEFAAKKGSDRPRVWGEGSLDYEKGRTKGHLAVKLTEQQKFSGVGSITFLIKPGMSATGKIEIDENEVVRFTGRLTFPDYTLFDEVPKGRKPIKVFSIKKRIGVPFLSLGPLGLQAQVRAGVFISYGFGPGVLKGGYIEAAFNPLEEQKDFDLDVGGRVHVPAHFGIFAYVGGGLSLDVLVAEVGGEIILSGGLQLDAEANADLKLGFSSQEGFTARGDMDLGLRLTAIFCVSAHAWAEAGVWRFKVTTGKTWELAKFPYEIGSIKVKTVKPISYSSANGLELPEFEIAEKPQIESGGAMEGALGGKSGEEQEGKPGPPKCPDIPDD